MTPEYKAEKEASVSHLGGGGIWEINLVTLVAPAAALLWAILQTRQRFFTPYTLPAAITDFALHCCAILFATTVYAGAPQVLNGLLLLPTIATFLQTPAKTGPPAKPGAKPEQNGKPAEPEPAQKDADLDPLPVKPFVTTYRGAMMLITCTSILAVDFHVFPRRFAKTESFGTSLMDLGVGSFVFAAGIVAARQQLKEQISGAPSFVARLHTAMRHSLPLFLLGLIRLYSVKGLQYAEHVSEYGVHWNFFFTLGLLPPTIALLQPVLRYMPSYGLLAFLVALGYELALFLPDGMKAYIILSERRPGDFLSQNREGVFSFFGYLAIFIAGMGCGTGILPRNPGAFPFASPQDDDGDGKAPGDPLDEDADWLASVLGSESSDAQDAQQAPAKPPTPFPQLKPEIPKTVSVHLVKWTLIWFILSVWALWRYGPRMTVSRRMANMPYVFWVCAFNTAQLLLFYLIEATLFPALYSAPDKETEKKRMEEATSKVMKAWNRNGLALFLLANLATGGINMLVQTWYMGDVAAMAVLVVYVAALNAVALALDHYDISIKL